MVGEWEYDLHEELKDPEFAKAYGAECAKSEFGLALLCARQRSGLTQSQLSEKLGLRQPYIAQLESGEANPTLSNAGRILAALGLKIVINPVPIRQGNERRNEETPGKSNTRRLSVAAEEKVKYKGK